MADTKPRLTYTEGRGLAEMCRIGLHAAGIEFEDVFIQTREDLLQLIKDGKLMFKQVPLLEIEGQRLIGSEPILRFASRRGNFYAGKTDEEKTKIDMLAMGARDFLFAGLVNYPFLKTPEAKEKEFQRGLKAAKEVYLPTFEKVLSENPSGFLVGDSLSIADVVFFDTITHLSDSPRLAPELDHFPHCKAFVSHISNLPRIKAYVSSPHRHGIPDQEHADVVNKIFNY